MSIFSDLLEEQIDESKVDDARSWYREKANEVATRIDTRRFIASNISMQESRVRLGHFYIYRYDPKHKETLPYYDAFPITLVIKRDKEGFLGLNMHYLPYQYRLVLMDSLYDFVTGSEDMTRIRVTYRILNNVSKLRFFRPCIKYYLNNNVQTRFLHIPVEDWDVAAFLPLQRFYKQKINRVHRDSILQIRSALSRE